MRRSSPDRTQVNSVFVDSQIDNDNQTEGTGKAWPIKTMALVICVLVMGAIGTVIWLNRQDNPYAARPRLLDLGATQCIPCKKMAPILEELKREYEGRLDVEFVDVWRIPGAADRYGVQAIPTQIFFDASGRELFRHTGFFAKEEILSKWRELGVDLKN